MRKLILHSMLLLAILSVSSCNYLDVDKWFDDTMKYDTIFSRKEYLERYMWNVAAQFPAEDNILANPYTPGPLATDEAFEPFNADIYQGMGYVIGEVNEENISGKSFYLWDGMYKIIRKTNIILSRMDEAADMTNLDRLDIWAYTYFMRAYAYYHLIMNFGPVILVGDDIYPSNEQPAAYANVRATYDESIDYACEQFEKAALYLPESQPTSFFGRPTRGAAYALIARLRLMQASPVFNGKGQTYFGNWKRAKDGAFYISQQYDDRKWAVAAAACERVMDMDYQLHTVPADKDSYIPPTSENQPFPDGVGGIDPLKSYSYMFNGETDGRKNKEFIWGRTANNLKLMESFPQSMDGYNGMSVSQKMVDLFYMNDGTDNWPEDAKPYQNDGTYDGTNFSTADETFSEYILKSGVFNMYRNREMRFYANIGFSGRFWRARSYSGTDSKKRDAQIKYDASSLSDGKHSSSGNKNDYPATGYVIIKYIHDDDAFSTPGGIVLEKFYPIIRYAEILLSYSEALNNLQGSHSVELAIPNGETKTYTESRDLQKIKKAFNQIRYRVGLPGIKDGDLASVDGFNKIIQRERAIEFLYENRRYYDVRRWGIYEDSERETMQGMDLNRSEMNGFFYKTVVDHVWIRHRVVDRKMMFLPISKYEIRKVDGLDQNPGWGD